MSRFNALLLVLAASVTPAFSADPPHGTTAPGADIDPATGLARTTVVRPLGDAPPAPAAPPAPREARESAFEGPRPHIALIVPTRSPVLGPVADAVRQGFLAAAEVAGRAAPPVAAMAVDNEGAALLEACQRAQANGAVLVVAGLTRDGATALARSDCPRQPTLALNEPQVAEPPVNLYSISLSLEQEARQVALQAVADGWRSAIVIASPSPLARRVQEAFEREWARAAGEVRGRVAFAGGPEQAPAIKERIAAINGDMVFLALDQAVTLAVRPYVSGMLPVYATSMSIDPRADATVNVDLQGLRYMDMPWFVQPDHPAVMVYPAPRAPLSVERERLYALGIDAFRIGQLLLRPDGAKAALDGVTGRIALEGPSHFTRTLVPAEVDSGRVAAIRAP